MNKETLIPIALMLAAGCVASKPDGIVSERECDEAIFNFKIDPSKLNDEQKLRYYELLAEQSSRLLSPDALKKEKLYDEKKCTK